VLFIEGITVFYEGGIEILFFIVMSIACIVISYFLIKGMKNIVVKYKDYATKTTVNIANKDTSCSSDISPPFKLAFAITHNILMFFGSIHKIKPSSYNVANWIY